MAMTKPAGVFLQLLSIPFMLFGCVAGMQDGSTAGWVTMVFGIALLFLGGLPAIKKPKADEGK